MYKTNSFCNRLYFLLSFVYVLFSFGYAIFSFKLCALFIWLRVLFIPLCNYFIWLCALLIWLWALLIWLYAVFIPLCALFIIRYFYALFLYILCIRSFHVLISRKNLDFAKLRKLQEVLWLTVIDKIFKFRPHYEPLVYVNYLHELSFGYPNYPTQKGYIWASFQTSKKRFRKLQEAIWLTAINEFFKLSPHFYPFGYVIICMNTP